jgi:glyoxylase-like metal-dependent hydrolase (beta-lactamase superfamily II)
MMRVTYLAHASLLVEAGGARLVTDPWLDGPTYLNAWWHFPAPVLSGAELRADYIYITHEHLDHFHVRTLQKLPRSTPILVGKFPRPRFRDKLRALGFTDVRELPHGRPVALGGLTVTSYQYRADDTALVIDDGETKLFDLNDCLLRASSLEQVMNSHGEPDLLAMSFANAEAYPIVYEQEEPADWSTQSCFDTFLEKVRKLRPRAFVPFASMFCFLSEDLFAINERIASPAGLIARAHETQAIGLPMNPGDRWTPERGHEVVSRVDWSKKPELLREYKRQNSDELAAIARSEVVEGGRDALIAASHEFFRGFSARVPWPLRKKLDLSIRVDVEGPAGCVIWLRFSAGKLDLAPPASDDQWDARIIVRDWPWWRCVTRADEWQTFGVACRFRVALRRGARDREVFFWFLLYMDDYGYLSPLGLMTPRSLGVFARRRRELFEYMKSILGGSFVDQSLRGKFES